MAEETVHGRAKQRSQGRANGQRHVARIGVVGEAETGHDIDRPGVKTVMRKCIAIGRFDGFGRAALNLSGDDNRVGPPQTERLGSGKDHQANTQTGAEHHGKPGEIGKLRFFARHTHDLFSRRQDRHGQKEEREEPHDDDVELIETFEKFPVQAAQRAVCVGRPDQRPDDQRDHDAFADQSDRQAVILVKARVLRLDL